MKIKLLNFKMEPRQRCMYVDKRNKREGIKKGVCPHVGCRVGEWWLSREQTKRHKYDGNSLVYTSLFLYPSVSLCHSVFSKKKKNSWPTFLKNTLALKIAPSLHSWHVRKWEIFSHWWLDWEKAAGSWTSRRERDRRKKREREKCLTWEIFF